jgi:3-isopropylmalate/(R)-2-methylmalate dehydratase large subunit
MGLTFAEKLLAFKAGRDSVQPGQIVEVSPDVAMSHDNAGLVIRQFRQIGVEKVWDASKIVIPLDHRVPAESTKTANAHKSIREFVREQGISSFYDIREGVCHQVLVEKGHVLPGTLALGTDSHTTSYGCVGAFGTGIGATEMAAVWATGKIWLRVPESIRVEVNGTLPDMVFPKDFILYLVGKLGAEGANYCSMEFGGPAMVNIAIPGRFTICNLSMEMGAKNAVVPVDRVTTEFLDGLRVGRGMAFRPDPGANYVREEVCNISKLVPQVACPHGVDNVKPVEEVEGTRIDQAVLGSCTNGRIEDLREAASVIAGHRIHPDVRMLVVPASKSVLLEGIRTGIITKLIEAGSVLVNPGCGPCLGAHEGILADGEVCIASTNRNFKGRMGSPTSEVYLASPATVAASAVAGKITDPRKLK